MPEESPLHTIQIGETEIPARYTQSRLSKFRGHMFRPQTPGYALVFPFGGTEKRSFHMMFVPFALDAVYIVDDVVRTVSRMRPWVGFSSGVADMVIELPAGEFDVSVGDTVAA